jgi:acyl-coenzyme A thioesterase PaaI-like protein
MPDRPAASAPAVVAEAGWEPIEPLRLEGGRGSFVSGDPQGDRLRVRYFRRTADGRLVGRAWFGPGALGPPGHAHGGSIAAVLDEAMGAAAWLSGFLVVAVRLDTSFQRLLPLGTDTFLEAWIDRVEGRKVWTLGRLLDCDDEPYAEAEGLFVTLDPARNRALLEKAAAALGLDPQELLARATRR